MPLRDVIEGPPVDSNVPLGEVIEGPPVNCDIPLGEVIEGPPVDCDVPHGEVLEWEISPAQFVRSVPVACISTLSCGGLE